MGMGYLCSMSSIRDSADNYDRKGEVGGSHELSSFYVRAPWPSQSHTYMMWETYGGLRATKFQNIIIVSDYSTPNWYQLLHTIILYRKLLMKNLKKNLRQNSFVMIPYLLKLLKVETVRKLTYLWLTYPCVFI